MTTKILIAGTDYGLQNVGDDAILAGMLEQFRSVEGLDITVATKHAREMSDWLNIKTIERSGKLNLLKVYKEVINTDILVVGGACVISDYSKNLKGLISGYPGFGLTLIALAKLFRKPVMVFGIGVEEVPSKLKKFFIKHIYNSVELITLRDEGSRILLQDGFGVTLPKIVVTADPVLGMSPPNQELIKNQISRVKSFDNGMPVVVVAFAYGVDKRPELINLIATMSDHIVNNFKANILFIPMNILDFNDRAGINKVAEQMQRKDAIEILELPYGYEEVMALLCEADMVISSRMHLLIFSTITNTPIVGISRVPKTDQFLMNFDLKSVISTDMLNFDDIKADLDSAWQHRNDIRQKLITNRNKMHTRAWDNIKYFKEIFTKN